VAVGVTVADVDGVSAVAHAGDARDIVFQYEDLDAWWDTQLDLSATLRDIVTELTPAQRDEAREAIDARLSEYVAENGSATLPGRTHVAAATA